MGQAEQDWAQGVLAEAGVVLPVRPLNHPQVRHNTLSRCYFCKYGMFTVLKAWAFAQGRSVVLEGSQASEAGQYRPGRAAIQQLGIRSPLAEIGLEKPHIREIARRWGMAWPDQPSRPCLLTRFAYGRTVNAALLRHIDSVENALQGVGLRHFRVRVLEPDRFALQITAQEAVTVSQNRAAIAAVFAAHGLSSWQVEQTATLSGYFDRP